MKLGQTAESSFHSCISFYLITLSFSAYLLTVSDGVINLQKEKRAVLGLKPTQDINKRAFHFSPSIFYPLLSILEDLELPSY